MNTDPSSQPGDRVVPTICGACHNSCGMLVHVRDGAIQAIKGNPDHPMNRGTLCVKGRAMAELTRSPQRLKRPMKRVGSRGEGRWQEIPWDEALDLMASRLGDIARQYGPETLFFSCGAPVMEFQRYGFSEFRAQYGTPNQLSSNLCSWPLTMALESVCGFKSQPDYDATKLIIMWGGNPWASMRPGHNIAYGKASLLQPITDAVKRGVPFIVIDPVYSETATHATEWIALRPGTDGALALAMLHVIIDQGLYDAAFVREWTIGFEQLRDHVRQYTPEWAAGVTGLPAEHIRRPGCPLRHGQAGHHSLGQHLRQPHQCHPGAARRWLPGGHHRQPGRARRQPVLSHRAALQDHHQASPAAAGPGEISPAMGGALGPRRHAHRPALPAACPAGPAHQSASPTPATPGLPRPCAAWTSWWSWTSSPPGPATSSPTWCCPTPASWSATTGAAIRPPTDCWWPCGSRSSRPCTNRARSTTWSWSWPGAWASPTSIPWHSVEELFSYHLGYVGLDLPKLQEKPIQLVNQFAYRKFESGLLRPDHRPGFNTPSGKVELYSQRFAGLGYEPLPTYHEPAESPISTPQVARDYPLIGVNRRPLAYVHYKYRNIPALRKLEPEPRVRLSPGDAGQRGIVDGEWVAVSSPRGRIRMKALVSGQDAGWHRVDRRRLGQLLGLPGRQHQRAHRQPGAGPPGPVRLHRVLPVPGGARRSGEARTAGPSRLVQILPVARLIVRASEHGRSSRAYSADRYMPIARRRERGPPRGGPLSASATTAPPPAYRAGRPDRRPALRAWHTAPPGCDWPGAACPGCCSRGCPPSAR